MRELTEEEIKFFWKDVTRRMYCLFASISIAGYSILLFAALISLMAIGGGGVDISFMGWPCTISVFVLFIIVYRKMMEETDV